MTEPALASALACLAPLDGRFVVVGGTAHRLFPLHPLGRDPGYELLTTEDVDIAVDKDLNVAHCGGTQIIQSLVEAGFKEEVCGGPYASRKYRVEGAGVRPYLEFIAPLRGDRSRQGGRDDRELPFAGIIAGRLPHVDLLLHEPWSVELQIEGGTLHVPVANPVAYLVQKLLIQSKRSRRKREKDLLYIYDTLAVFSGALDEIGAEAHRLLPRMSPKRVRQAVDSARRHALELNDGVRQAASIAAAQGSRAPTPDQIVEACRTALPRLLASSRITLE